MYCLPFCIEKKIKRTNGMYVPIDGTYEMSHVRCGASGKTWAMYMVDTYASYSPQIVYFFRECVLPDVVFLPGLPTQLT